MSADKAIPKVRAVLGTLKSAKWFSEVLAYRNFAHQSFHVVEADYAAGGRCNAVMLQAAIKGSGQRGLDALDGYLREMAAAAGTAFK